MILPKIIGDCLQLILDKPSQITKAEKLKVLKNILEAIIEMVPSYLCNHCALLAFINYPCLISFLYDFKFNKEF